MAHHAGLDYDDAGAAGQEAVGANTRRAATAEGGAVARADPPGTRDPGAGLLCGGQGLRDERSSTLRTGRADAARTDAEIVLAAHDL